MSDDKKFCYLTAHLLLAKGELVVKKSRAIYEDSVQPLLNQGFVWTPDKTSPLFSQNVSQRITVKRISQRVSVDAMAGQLGITPRRYQEKEDGIAPWYSEEIEKVCDFLGLNYDTVLPQSVALGSFNAPWSVTRHMFCTSTTTRPVELVKDDLAEVPNIRKLLDDLRHRRDELGRMAERLPGYNLLKINHRTIESMRAFNGNFLHQIKVESHIVRQRIKHIEQHLVSEVLTWGHVMQELDLNKQQALSLLANIGYQFKGTTWLCTRQDIEEYKSKTSFVLTQDKH